MKKFASVIVAVVLVVAVGSSVVSGTMAGFYDVEHSIDNHMQSGTRMIELSGGPIEVNGASPSTWYEHEMAVINVGNLDGTAWLHLMNLVSIEDAPTSGNATAEPELVAEEGGCVGEDADGDPVYVGGLGTDTGDDTLGPAELAMANFVEIDIWYDADDDDTTGTNGFEELVAEGKLAEIACQWYDLGFLPASTQINTQGGGWGTYFPYTIGDPLMKTTLVAGKQFIVGKVTVETVGTDLIVTYDTTPYSWPMGESHLYVDTVEPTDFKGWGKFPYTSNPDNKPPDDTQYDKDISDYIHQYTIPLSTIDVGWQTGDTLFIAAHAAEAEPGQETAWAMGEFRRLLICLHFPDIDEDDLGLYFFDESIPEEAKWDHWPTNAYMGDKCVFDIEFLLAWEGQVPPP